MSAETANKTTTADREIVTTRVFDAPRELVWEAWTNPQHVVNWWGPRGFTITIEEMDVRPGGVWKHTMHGPDGTDYANKSIFKEVVKPERIVYSHGGGKKGGPGIHFEMTWTFEAVGEKTRVTLRHVFATAADRDRVVKEFGAVEGAKQTLDRLGEHLTQMGKNPPAQPAGQTVVVTRVFDATAETVFDAWLDPAVASRWLFATPKGKMKRVEIDARVGGKFVIAEQRSEMLAEHLGTYLEIDRPRRLVFEFGCTPNPSAVTRVTVDIKAHGARCELTLTHEGVWPDYRERVTSGWTMVLGHLAEVLSKEFVISREFDAPRELVWQVFSDPEHMKKWWGPKGFTVLAVKMDFRPGGSYLYCLRSPDGHDMWGKFAYREIVALERMVFINSFSDEKGGLTRHPGNPNWPLEMFSTVTFAEHKGKTTLTVRWLPYNANEVERKTFDDNHPSMNQGWGGTLDQLAAYLTKAKS